MIIMLIVTLINYGFELYLLAKAVQTLGNVKGGESVRSIKYDNVKILCEINFCIS